MVDKQSSFTEAFSGKKVFLTGHTGFKGTWMLAWLHKLGADIKGYALPPENDIDIFNSLPADVKFQSVLADIRDKNKLTDELLKFKPDYIFHLAAQPLVRYAYKHPAETFEVNVTGTANLLEAAAALPNKCSIIVITTDKVYYNYETHHAYQEDDRLGGYDPYSASKACAELVVDSFRNSFFNPDNYAVHQKAIASARAGNVIGGGDWNNERIIPDLVGALNRDETLKLRSPNAVRPWQFVLEPIEGYLLLGARLHQQPQLLSSAYNFGPYTDSCMTVKELVEQGISYWGKGNWEDISDTRQPHEAGLLKLDISRAGKELGWYPRLSMQQAIEWTLSWYKNHFEQGQNMMFTQIEEFETLRFKTKSV